ncbi:MAG: rRNA adenine N-6-methyltransferase family protein, partial [Bacteroidales bacterium]
MQHPVRAKKHLGQHFLMDDNIAGKIVASLKGATNVLEIGPGTGILTKHLIEIPEINLKLIEIDRESVEYLLK